MSTPAVQFFPPAGPEVASTAPTGKSAATRTILPLRKNPDKNPEKNPDRWASAISDEVVRSMGSMCHSEKDAEIEQLRDLVRPHHHCLASTACL
jgi:hypothetical protein